MRLPDAIVVGAPKCGTTTLCAALARHPQIYMHPRKETHFFNLHYTRRGMGWYAEGFAAAPEGATVMEGTPDYAMSDCVERVMQRMAQDIPDVKLIYMVRDPVERVESHYVQMIADGHDAPSINEAVELWPEIVETSRYGHALEIMTRYFPRSAIHVIPLADYAKQPDDAHRKVLEFLKLDAGEGAIAAMAAQGRLHKRENQAADHPLLAMMRRTKWFDRVAAAAPKSLKSVGKALLRRKVQRAIEWDPAVRARISESLQTDWERFQSRLSS